MGACVILNSLRSIVDLLLTSEEVTGIFVWQYSSHPVPLFKSWFELIS